MNHIVPSVLAMAHSIKGFVGHSMMASAGGAVALGEAFRLIKDGTCDRVLVGGVDLNVNK